MRSGSQVNWIVCFLAIILICAGCGGGQADEVAPFGPDNLARIWSYDVGSSLVQPPIQTGDVVIVVPHEGALLALEASSGRVRWKYDPPYQFYKGSVSVGQDAVYLGDSNGRLLALDVNDGILVWEVELGGEVILPLLIENYSLYVVTSPVAEKPNTFAWLYMLNAYDGKILWEAKPAELLLTSPVRIGEWLYTAGLDRSGNVHLYGQSSKTGEPRWSLPVDGGEIKGIYAVEGMIVYQNIQGRLNGVESSSGTLRWQDELIEPDAILFGSEDAMYVIASNGYLEKWYAEDGSRMLDFKPVAITSALVGTPLLHQGYLYALTQNGEVLTLDQDDGSMEWTFSTGIVPDSGLSIAGGRLCFAGADGQVYAYASERED